VSSSALRLVELAEEPDGPWPLLEALVRRWFARGILPRDRFDLLADQLKARVFTAARLWSDHALEAARDSIARAIEGGLTVREWRERDWKRLAAAYGNGGTDASWYVDTVFRTNVQAAYAGGRYAEMFSAERSRSSPYVMYNAIEDNRVRPEHLALDGKVFRKDDANARRYFPPLGFNCRCSLIELDEDDFRDGGYRLTSGSSIAGLPTEGDKTVGPPPEGWDSDRVLSLVPAGLQGLVPTRR
jgi:SPP1 gp7 family putative phage head morphogenesis protein